MNWRPSRRAAGTLPLGAFVTCAFLACGGKDGFPEAEPCEPVATPAANRTVDTAAYADSVYRRLTSDGLLALENTSATFRAEWPFDRPSSNVEFREAFVDYARTMVCTAEFLRDLEPRDPSLQPFDDAFDTAMDETIAVTESGRDSVRARNTSDFREWRDSLQAMPGRYDEVLALLPAE